MKCYCGAEIRAGAKYCQECGRPVREKSKTADRASAQKITPGNIPLSDQPTERYEYNENVMYVNSTVPTKRHKKNVQICPRCGAGVPVGIMICQDCGFIMDEEVRKKQPEYDPPNNKRLNKEPAVSENGSSEKNGLHTGIPPVREQALINERSKKTWLIGIIVGLYILVLGLAGKVMMVRLTAEIQQEEYFSELNEEIGGIVDQSINRSVTNMVIALIRNDPSGFVNAVSRMTETGFSLAGDTYGLGQIGSWITGSLASSVFEEIRAELKSEAGFRWPFLQVMAYYRIFLLAGAALLLAFGILFFINGGHMSDVIQMKFQPLLIGAAMWTVLLFVIALTM